MPMYDDIDQDHGHDFEQKFEHNFYQNVDSTENFILSTENLEGGKNIWENYIFCDQVRFPVVQNQPKLKFNL